MNVCIIPARGGSKRIPRKNIKYFVGKPIIAYSIEAAIKSKCFDKIIVSTDDEEIASVAKNYGASVPFIRPDNLSDDYSKDTDVIKHAIKFIEENHSIKYVCLLYPTAPFVSDQIIIKSLRQLKDSKSSFCFTVCNFAYPIQRALRLTADSRVEMINSEFRNYRSQDMEEAYHDAGQLYWGKVNAFKEDQMRFSKVSSPFFIPKYLAHDIDTMEDWINAEAMYKALKKTKF
jgi:pseudaminic acid cytidylyltransferase